MTLGWALLGVTAVALFVTVRYWAKIFLAVLAYCALRSTMLVVFAAVGIARHVSLWVAVTLGVYLWGMTAFTYRFHDQKVFSIVDQFALTTALLFLFLAIVKSATSGVNTGLMPFALALLALVLPASFKLTNSSL